MAAQLDGLEGVAGLSEVFVTFVTSIRMFLRDHPDLNRLIAGEESSDRMICWAVVDMLSDFNSTPPLLGSYTLEQLLELNAYRLARYGTISALLESIALLQTRNQLNFSDGGVSVGVSDKGPQLMQWAQTFDAKYQQARDRLKVALNIEGIMGIGGVHSELAIINGLSGFLSGPSGTGG